MWNCHCRRRFSSFAVVFIRPRHVEPISFAGIGALFLLTALLAAYLPGRRAAQVDPMVALRCD
jgi:ABC-type lipoprotein release transport system permease subunit